MRSVLFAALVTLVPTAVHAQAPSTEVVLVAETGAVELDLERVGDRVHVETGAVVRVATGPVSGSTTLHVRVEGGARVVLVLVRVDGSTMERTTAVPDDAAERTETIAILAVNMLHDEAAELLALLGPSDAGPPIVVVGEPTPPPATVEVVIDTATPAEPPVVPETIAPEVEAPAAPPRETFLRLGLGMHASSVPRGGGHTEGDFLAGFELGWTPAPWIAVGGRDMAGGSTVQGDAWHVDGSPFVEVGLPLDFVTLYADVAVHLQVIVDGEDAFGVAPYVAPGVRFRLCREFSIAAETAIRVVASERFLTGLYSLPQGAFVWSGGLTLLFHVS